MTSLLLDVYSVLTCNQVLIVELNIYMMTLLLYLIILWWPCQWWGAFLELRFQSLSWFLAFEIASQDFRPRFQPFRYLGLSSVIFVIADMLWAGQSLICRAGSYCFMLYKSFSWLLQIRFVLNYPYPHPHTSKSPFSSNNVFLRVWRGKCSKVSNKLNNGVKI